MGHRTIASQENVEACTGSGTKEDTISEAVPLLSADRGNIVVRKFSG